MQRLGKLLEQIDGAGYNKYKEILGTYQGEGYRLHIDYVQPDPFAGYSRFRVEIGRQLIAWPDEWVSPRFRRVAFEDFVARTAGRAIDSLALEAKGTGNSGRFWIDAPGQEVLERTAVRVGAKTMELRLSVGLPARGRRIMGRQAAVLLCQVVPRLVQAVVALDRDSLKQHLKLADQQQAIRNYLADNGLVAFVANGSVLPRESGVSDLPLPGAVPFQSPPQLAVEIPLPHGAKAEGMGIPQGVTVVVGGGYHGKSTLLKAVERGVYNHVAGDGREFVISDPTAYKIRAEDGRRVAKVDISPFISGLPYGRDTSAFSSDDASGSTSQAANIMEALAVGARVLLIDEDTSATNFMIRDGRMQALVAKEKEPITPFVDKVRQLYTEHQVSTVLVIGGSGDYLDVADTVIMMDSYVPVDVTQRARQVAKAHCSARQPEGGGIFSLPAARVVKPHSLNPRRGRSAKVDARGRHTILFGSVNLNLSAVEQLVDTSQTRALANMLRFISCNLNNKPMELETLLAAIEKIIDERGLEGVSPYPQQHPGDMARPRMLELAAAINRLRTLAIQ